jgi:DNA-binding CsgD family transcriptional regulator
MGRWPDQQAVANRAFDIAASAAQADSIATLNARFRDPLGELGFQLFACLDVIEADFRRRIEILFGEGFEAWDAHYRRMEFADDDAMLPEAASTPEPFFWTDVASRRTLPLRAQRILDDAKKFRLHDGFVAPLRNTDGSICFVLFAGDAIDSQDSYTRLAAHLLALRYGTIGRRLHHAEHRRAHPMLLTPRQRDCLKWVHAGKCSRDIGKILAISANVVDEHIERACQRLGVETRTQAVLAALRRGVEL